MTQPAPGAGPYRHMPAPVLPEANVDGPIVEHSRITGYSNFAAGSTAIAVAGNRSGYAGAVAASSIAATSASFEYYTSDDVQEFVKKLLEDTGTIKRIYSGAEGWEIKGVGGVPYRSCGACDAVQYVELFTLVAFLRVPLVGMADANVELRVYHNHDFIKSYIGTGSCTGVGTLYWGLWHRGGNGITTEECALSGAVADAVRKLQDSPPSVPLEEAK